MKKVKISDLVRALEDDFDFQYKENERLIKERLEYKNSSEANKKGWERCYQRWLKRHAEAIDSRDFWRILAISAWFSLIGWTAYEIVKLYQ